MDVVLDRPNLKTRVSKRPVLWITAGRCLSNVPFGPSGWGDRTTM